MWVLSGECKQRGVALPSCGLLSGLTGWCIALQIHSTDTGFPQGPREPQSRKKAIGSPVLKHHPCRKGAKECVQHVSQGRAIRERNGTVGCRDIQGYGVIVRRAVG